MEAQKRYTMFDEEVFNLFVQPGEIIEVRLLGAYQKASLWQQKFAKGTVCGYYDNFKAFASDGRSIDSLKLSAAYFTLQVIDPRLLGRANNRFLPSDKTTSHKDVIFYRWLPIDIDPVRPAGVSASDEELQAAIEVRDQVDDYLRSKLDFSMPIKAISGNGAHLLYRLPDLPAQDKKSIELVRNTLIELSKRFDNDKAKVDTSVFNPARIWKLYGTTARKGDPVSAGPNRQARPHRMSYIETLGEN